MSDITTPYMWSDNLSVDNALSSRQIIHQLITKINELVAIYNNLEVDVDNKIDKKITKELNDLESELTTAIQKAFEQSTDYTDLTEQRLNDRIEKVTTEGKKAILELESELKVYTDTRVLECNTKIMELYSEFDRLSKNSFASISPLDGTLKSNRDCFYDMLHVYQRTNGVNLDGIIAFALFMSNGNFPEDAYLVSTNIGDILKNCNAEYWSRYSNYKAIYLTDSDETYGGIDVLARQIVPPTWGNIVSCGIHALAGLNKKSSMFGDMDVLWGSGTVLYNMYYNEGISIGTQFGVMNSCTGTEFKPFDITKA